MEGIGSRYISLNRAPKFESFRLLYKSWSWCIYQVSRYLPDRPHSTSFQIVSVDFETFKCQSPSHLTLLVTMPHIVDMSKMLCVRSISIIYLSSFVACLKT